MQEFSSVTASSYDADSLAPLLNEKAADGWSVVAIVSAGSNIVAYLEREASEDSAPPADSTEESAVEPTVIEAGEPVAESFGGAADTATESAASSYETASDSVTETTDAVGEAVPTLGAAATEVVAETAPVEEPAGWATAPDDSISSAPEPAIAEPVIAEPAVAEPVVPEPVVPEPVAAEPEPVVAEPEPEPVAPAQPESTVPAGWYADPSGRYELRYWDGTAWTEHVSRAGQQFTDPPVA